jgi:clorobiocin biosynthesis protein CloN6
MAPFLDVGSRFFEEPDAHGYRIFHRTLEEHRQALVAPVWHERLNYCTDWLSRRDIQEVSYEAIAELVRVKGEIGLLPGSWCKAVLSSIEQTKCLLAEIEHAVKTGGLDCDLKRQIAAYNRKILAFSSDQIVPTPRPFGGRWFDDVTIPPEMIEELVN